MLNTGADQFLQVILFWSIFLPCGTRFSLDSLRGGWGSAGPRQVCHMGTIAYVVQLALVYLFAALAKHGADWRSDGTAIYYALSLGPYSTPVGQWLRSIPELSRLLTPAVLGLEFIAPLLLIAPVWTTPMRIVGVLGLVGMQAGFGFTLANLGLFSVISCVVLLGLLPSWFWDRVVASARARARAQVSVTRAACARLGTVGAHLDARSGDRRRSLRDLARERLAVNREVPARELASVPWTPG
jgi:hypothetical protein